MFISYIGSIFFLSLNLYLIKTKSKSILIKMNRTSFHPRNEMCIHRISENNYIIQHIFLTTKTSTKSSNTFRNTKHWINIWLAGGANEETCKQLSYLLFTIEIYCFRNKRWVTKADKHCYNFCSVILAYPKASDNFVIRHN